MGDSIVYEHESIKLNSNDGLCKPYRLVKFKDQIISVEICYNKKGEYIVVTNPDTKTQLIKLKLNCTPNQHKWNTNDINAFMYSDSLLWVGLNAFTYGVFVFDMDKLTLYKEFEFGIDQMYHEGIKKVTPIGTKCFIIEPCANHYDVRVFSWANLLEPINENIQHIYVLEPKTFLYSIDWNSSSIEHLAKSQYIKAYLNSEKIDLLDGHFNLIITLNVCDMFSDYQEFSLEELTLPSSKFSKLLSVNANCLIYVEKIVFINKLVSKNIYCWDFTTGTQVKFTNTESGFDINYIVPFRSTNKIKIICNEFVTNGFMADNYYHPKQIHRPHTKCKVYEFN